MTLPVIKIPSTHNDVMFPQSARLPTYCPTESMIADILTDALLKCIRERARAFSSSFGT
jgi:hypothetical protein